MPPGNTFLVMGQIKVTMVNERKSWPLIIVLTFCHNPSYASGDPSVLYWLGFIAVVHIGLFIALYKKESSAKKRVAKLFAYSRARIDSLEAEYKL